MNESTQSDDDSQAAWPGGIVAVTLFVEDLAAAKRFYSEVFELPVLLIVPATFVAAIGAAAGKLLRIGFVRLRT